MNNHPRYAISLLPDELYSGTLTMTAIKLCDHIAQDYLLSPENIPHLPIVEFTAPNDQAAHALFNRWATKHLSMTVVPYDLSYGREQDHDREGEFVPNPRLLLFCDPTEELLDLQSTFEELAQRPPYRFIYPDDDDDYPAIKLAGLRDAEYGQISMHEVVAQLIFSPQTMTPALGRCDEHGHMIRVLAPRPLLAAT